VFIRFTAFAFAVKLRKYGSKKADAVVEQSFARQGIDVSLIMLVFH